MKDILTSFTEIINGVAVLIDPDKMNSHQKLLSLIEKCEEALSVEGANLTPKEKEYKKKNGYQIPATAKLSSLSSSLEAEHSDCSVSAPPWEKKESVARWSAIQNRRAGGGM